MAALGVGQEENRYAYRAFTGAFGGGVIGNTTGSGPVIRGSSPLLRANGNTRCCP